MSSWCRDDDDDGPDRALPHLVKIFFGKEKEQLTRPPWCCFLSLLNFVFLNIFRDHGSKGVFEIEVGHAGAAPVKSRSLVGCTPPAPCLHPPVLPQGMGALGSREG